ncbi:methylated-DNA--[protein]-cysteine S-methyltransferase [Virgifigura deserti]|uniref:methylated-DNA--[protein]-cysteine S-methyltransferase n=1 Tax=Virgifigura deserti TaxID=2268457 RepID=UPI003CCBA39D
MDLFIDRIPSPIGTILLVSDGEALRALDFEEYEPRMRLLLRRQYGDYHLMPATNPGGLNNRIMDYLAGRFDALDAVPVRTGGTPFQREVWAALRAIPIGSTTTYGRLAAMLGKPAASRAVGLANGSNPVSIVVPCHRVIGADGTLTGYGGGLARKRWLLEHEGVRLPGFGAKRTA